MKPVLSGHPRDLAWCPLNKGCPLNRGYINYAIIVLTIMIKITNIRLFPTLAHEQMKFNIVCNMFLRNSTTGTATVTNRSIILYKEQCLCSNYVLRKKLSIVDCFWF